MPGLHRAVGIALDGGTGQVLLERGAALPASARTVVYTAADVRAHTNERIAELTLLEGDGAGLERTAGTVELRGDRARRDVPAGSAVQVSVSVDRERRAQVDVYVPVLDEGESITVRLADEAVPAEAGSRPSTAHQLSDSVYERLLTQRIIVLGATVDDELARHVSSQMFLLAAEDPDADIKLYVNSPGGSVSAGMSVYDTMQLISCDVATTAMGMAAGMGQFLLSAGAPGKRSVLPHSRIQLTQVTAGSAVPDDVTQVARLRLEIAEMIARHTGWTAAQVLADQDAGLWFSAAEAVAYGLADQVVDQRGRVTGRTHARSEPVVRDHVVEDHPAVRSPPLTPGPGSPPRRSRPRRSRRAARPAAGACRSSPRAARRRSS